MVGNAATTLGAVAVGLGIAMAAGTGIAAADSVESKAEATSASSSRDDEKPSAKTESESDRSDMSAQGADEQKSDSEADDADDADQEASSDEDEGASDEDADSAADKFADHDGMPTSGDDNKADAGADQPAVSEQPQRSDHAGRDEDDDLQITESPVEDDTAVVEPDVDRAGVAEAAVPVQASPPPTAADLVAVGTTSAPKTTPAAPTSILGWIAGAAAWVQREVDYFANGGAVTAAPGQSLVSSSDGAALGDLNVVADPRDRLSFDVIGQPANGAVVLGDNGKFAYVPSTYPVGGVADSFTVAIRNQGFNLRSLLGLLNPTLNTTLVRVDVEVPPTEPSNNTTAGFTIINMTGYDLTLTSGTGDFDGPVPRGSVIRTGERQHFEVIVNWKDDDRGVLHYTSARPGAPETVLDLKVSSWFSGSTPTINCGTTTCDVAYDGSTLTATILAPPHTAIEVPVDQADRQTAILEQFCGEGALGTCSFTATGQAKDYALNQGVDTFRNEFDAPASLTEQISTVYSQKTSYSVSAKVGVNIFKLISAEVGAKYGNEWTETYTFSDTFKVQLAGWRAGSISSETPIVRYTGDFTVVVGNTTWYLRETTIEQADTSGTRPTRFTYDEWSIAPTTDTATLA